VKVQECNGYLLFTTKTKLLEIVKHNENFYTLFNLSIAMLGYKHPCKYCNQLIPPNSNVCPLCGKVNPLGPYRCPKCRAPIEKNWKACSRCGLALEITCPSCKKTTFFGDYCQHCDAPLWTECKNCHKVQPITNEKCVNCGKKLQ
jgi:RNA polymerase subunit RPABC4/transcription elongation factor Spt4